MAGGVLYAGALDGYAAIERVLRCVDDALNGRARWRRAVSFELKQLIAIHGGGKEGGG